MIVAPSVIPSLFLLHQRDMLVKLFLDNGAISEDSAILLKDSDLDYISKQTYKLYVYNLNKFKFIKEKVDLEYSAIPVKRYYLDVREYQHQKKIEKIFLWIFAGCLISSVSFALSIYFISSF